MRILVVLGFVVFAFTAAFAQSAATIPVNVNDFDSGNVQVGVIQVDTPGGSLLAGNFFFVPPGTWGYLDNWYDFRWINLVVSYDSGGGPQGSAPGIGTLPGIDPPPSATMPDNPFYYSDAKWSSSKQVHDEGTRSSFIDQPGAHPVGTVIGFETYLVVQDKSSKTFATNTFCVIQAFSWTFTQTTAGGGTSSFGATIPATTANITQALANSASAPFNGWQAFTGCVLLRCTKGERTCSPSAGSSPLGPLPFEDILTYTPGSGCTLTSPEDPLEGFDWFGTSTDVPLGGDIALRFTDTGEPDLIDIEIIALDLAPVSPILLDGHTIDVLDSRVVEENVFFHPAEAFPNVYGAYVMEFDILIDGFFPHTVTEQGWLDATYDPQTGEWSEITFGNAFDDPGDPPMVPIIGRTGSGALFMFLAALLAIGVAWRWRA